MSTGSLARNIGSSISFRVFMALITAAFFVVTLSVYVTTREQPIRNTEGDVTVKENGSVFQGNRRVSQSIRTPEGSVIHLLLRSGTTEEPIEAYYYFTVQLPKEVEPSESLTDVISIQGLQDYAPFLTTPSTLQVDIPSVLDEGLTKVKLVLPPGTVNEPWYVHLASFVIDFTLVQWAAIASGLLLIGLLYSKFISLQLGVHPKTMQSEPPGNLTPLEVAIVIRGSITADDMSAFMYDMAGRGYLQIIAKQGTTYVLPQDGTQPIASYESHIIPIVAPYSTPMPLAEVLTGLQKDMFSLTVSASYEEIYRNLTAKGVFQDNPRIIHLKYKTIAILIQVMSVLQVIVSYFFLSTTPGLVIVGLAGYVIGLLIHQNGYRSLRLTPLGKDLTAQIFQFKAFLSSPEPIGTTGAQGFLFYRYLPYAMVLKCPDEWLARFKDIDFQIPQWFMYEGLSFYTPAEFINHVQTITQEIGTVFTRLKDPNVD